MATEIGKLIAVFEGQTSHFDAANKRIEAGLQKTEAQAKKTGAALDTSFKTPSKSLGDLSTGLSTVLGGRLSGLTTGVSGLSTSMSELGASTAATGLSMSALAGPIGVATVALLAETAAAAGLVVGLIELAKSAAETQGKLYDMSQQTGVSVETLSALGELAKTTGGSLEGVVASLGIFQRNLETATDSTTKQAEAFAQLGVEITDTEQTLRDTLSQLSKMPEGFRQTALALELFGRGGKQMLAILKESHGDIDKTIIELQRLGLANTDNARRADELNDQLVHLETQLLGLKVMVGNQVIPALLTALKELEKAINDNRDAINALGVVVKFVAGSIGLQFQIGLAAANAAIKFHQPFVEHLINTYERLKAVMQWVSGNTPVVNPNAIPIQPLGTGAVSGADLLNQAGKAWRANQKPFSDWIAAQKATGGGGGGRAGGGRATVDEGLQLLKRLQAEFDALTPKTRAEEIATELLGQQYAKINPQLRTQIELLARSIDAKKKTLETEEQLREEQERVARVTADVTATITEWAQEVEDLNSGLPEWIARIRDFIKEKAQEGYVWDRETKQILLNTAARREQLRVMEEGATRARRVMDFEGTKPNILDNEAGVAGKGPDLGDMEARLELLRDQVRGLAFELSDVFAYSIEDGFDRGVKSGLATLSIGLLRIVEDVFLRRMAEGLSKMLEGMATGGGGSWWKTLLGIGISAVAGGIGGIGGKAGGGSGGTVLGKAFATGGYLPPGEWGLVGEQGPEFAYGGKTGMTIKPAGEQTIINNYYIQMAPVPKGSYQSPKSARQQGELVMAYIKGNQT